MSRLRLVTLATLTPEPELELVAGHGGADRLAEQVGLDAVRRQRIDQRATARLDLGLVDRSAASDRVRRLAGGSTHWPRLAPGPSSSSDCSVKPGSTVTRVGELAVGLGPSAACRARPSPRRARRRTPSASAARPTAAGRSSASTCCRTRCVPCGRSASATAPTPLLGVRQHRPQRGTGEHQRPANARRDQHDDGPTGGDQAAQRFADKRTDPTAGAYRECRSRP